MLRSRLLVALCGSVLLLLWPGCSSPPKREVLQPVGPAPQLSAHPENAGYLVVYSAWSHFVDQGSTGHHSRYTVSADDGTFSRVIINHADRFDEGPLRLALPAAAYHVSARSAHFGRVNVPVVIKERQTTFVYLDGSSHLQAPSAEQTSAVRLPDGEIVGWSATVANNSSN
jgi:hypothetical protein